MYDPHREYFASFDPFGEAKAIRDKVAQELWTIRKAFRKVGMGDTVKGKKAWEFLRADPPEKATVNNLREKARDLWEYACGPISHGYDTESYSACGMDDYIGEKMDYARSEALAIWRCVGRFD